MPTYEYACTSCGHHLEVVQSFADQPLTACPTCEGPLRKVFGSIGIVLKGSGFYKTDNRSSSRGGKSSGHSSGDGAAATSGSDSGTTSSGDSSSSATASSSSASSAGSSTGGAASSPTSASS